MESQSARATTAAESRFRVAKPNSLPRTTAIIPLDPAAAATLAELRDAGWQRAIFVDLDEGGDWLAELPDRTRALVRAVTEASLVLLVATAGADARAAAIVAEAAQARGRMIAAVVLDSGDADPAALERSLAVLRPHATMLVLADGTDYIAAMLEALRA
ncbi:hypothetical protein [Falsiroseomonas sp.]|uniref:hypothetical protein n=1 Tax=Falsiroseomonas sp. TaxID=2870721 RepID=UPI003F71CF3E